MGHSTDLFVAEPPAGCICAVCHDVMEDATSIGDCGHSFCAACLDACLDLADAPCPSCRTEITSYIPCFALRDVVGGLKVRCPEGGVDGEGNKKRKRGDNDDVDDGEGKRGDNDGGNATPPGCNWTGALRDLKSHGGVCDYKMVGCSIDGCDHECLRKNMNAHLSGAGLVLHMNLMKNSIVADCEKKMRGLEEKMAKDMLHLRYVSDCRSWIEYKPDALFDVSIHKIVSKSYHVGGDRHITGLLCMIPGPTGSDWEGAMVPMTLRYHPTLGRACGAPKCKFPVGFFHPNVYPIGTVCVRYLIGDSEWWTPEMTLPEVLFSVQQLLAHPNVHSPCQTAAYEVYANQGKEQYRIRVQEEIKRLSNSLADIVGGAKVMKDIQDDEVVEKMDIVANAELFAAGKKAEREPPNPPPFQRDANGKVLKDLSQVPFMKGWEHCECSCCAWGQVFWDDKRKMRFLFGV